MQGTIAREDQEVQGKRANTGYGDEFSAVDVSEEAHHFHTQPSADFIGSAYERFLRMPVVLVLATLWLAGIALLSLCALMLYLLGTSLAPALTGG